MKDTAVASHATEAWARRRRRARRLVERHAFARDLLRLYEALLDVQEPAFLRARDDQPDPASLAGYAARIIDEVAEATNTAGPPTLAVAVRERLREAVSVAAGQLRVRLPLDQLRRPAAQVRRDPCPCSGALR